eukprot:scaffold12669_cov21-Tisochrysis_lutea.AAC.2
MLIHIGAPRWTGNARAVMQGAGTGSRPDIHHHLLCLRQLWQQAQRDESWCWRKIEDQGSKKDFVDAAASLSVIEDANGSTVFQYSAMHTAGTYKLEVMNPQREVLYVGVVGVTAAHVSASGSTVILPEGIKAGQIGYISVELHDEFNNTISDAAPSNLAALIRHETDQDFEPVVLEPEGLACRLGMEQYRWADRRALHGPTIGQHFMLLNAEMEKFKRIALASIVVLPKYHDTLFPSYEADCLVSGDADLVSVLYLLSFESLNEHCDLHLAIKLRNPLINDLLRGIWASPLLGGFRLAPSA